MIAMQKARVLAATENAIAEAAAILRAGGLVAFSTETVYGLGADATRDEAVARIFAAKGRPHFNPLIVHVSSLEEAEKFGIFPPQARYLAESFWPGPLTLVVKKRGRVALSPLVTAGLETVALRVPDHEVAQRLLQTAKLPIAAPSANRSGHVSATAAKHVAADFGSSVDLILDSGPCRAGIESSIVSFEGESPMLLRPGAIAREDMEALAGKMITAQSGAKPTAPGMLPSHYAPRARLRLNATVAETGEALLAFGPGAPKGENVLNLSPSGNVIEAAANLFAYLRRLDATGATSIAVMPIPAGGLGEAINDRLRRAAAPRDKS